VVCIVQRFLITFRFTNHHHEKWAIQSKSPFTEKYVDSCARMCSSYALCLWRRYRTDLHRIRSAEFRIPLFVHHRHKPPCSLEKPRELVLVCAPMRSNVNLSRIVRTASCCAVQKIIACGRPKIDPKIARVAPDECSLEVHRSLSPVLQTLRKEGFQLVGLEQTSNSESLYSASFVCKTALVVGNERMGLESTVLELLDRVVEIPVFGLPYSFNVATASAMALYEYCRQYPEG
jgi:tRNA G18 (ribose-2'-O)-methylase SpoU